LKFNKKITFLKLHISIIVRRIEYQMNILRVAKWGWDLMWVLSNVAIWWGLSLGHFEGGNFGMDFMGMIFVQYHILSC